MMAKIELITEEDLKKYKEIFDIALLSFGWTSEDSVKLIKDGKEYILFGYMNVFMRFGYTEKDELEFTSFVVNDDGKVVSFALDGYQVNVNDNQIYLINEDGFHQSLLLMKNSHNPEFEVSSNGILTYMQYDSKRDIKLVTKSEHNILGDATKKVIYHDYLEEPFYVSVESNALKREQGLFFLGKKDAYYRLDFDIWKNRWQYDLATMQEFGVGAVLSTDTVSLQGGNREFSRYYKSLLSIGDYFTLTGFPITRPYKKEDIESIVESLSFNTKIPPFIVQLFNKRFELAEDFQRTVDAYYRVMGNTTGIQYRKK